MSRSKSNILWLSLDMVKDTVELLTFLPLTSHTKLTFYTKLSGTQQKSDINLKHKFVFAECLKNSYIFQGNKFILFCRLTLCLRRSRKVDDAELPRPTAGEKTRQKNINPFPRAYLGNHAS